MGDPTSAAGFSWKELIELVEERLPLGRLVAPLILTIVVIAALVWGIKFIYVEALEPLGRIISAQQVPVFDSWTALLVIQVALTFAVGIVFWSLFRTMKRIVVGLTSRFDHLLKDVSVLTERMSEVERNAADWQDTREALTSVHARLVQLEPSPLPVGTVDDLRHEVLLRLMDAPRIKPVGDRSE